MKPKRLSGSRVKEESSSLHRERELWVKRKERRFVISNRKKKERLPLVRREGEGVAQDINAPLLDKRKKGQHPYLINNFIPGRGGRGGCRSGGERGKTYLFKRE